MPDRSLRILTVADVPPDPNSGAAGKIVQANRVLRELGHEVRELWSSDIGPRRIRHGNLHSLLEQPRQMRAAILREINRDPVDVILSHQPQSYLAAEACRAAGFHGRFFVVSQGVEARISPILTAWHRTLGVPQSRFPQSLISPWLQRRLLTQWSRVCAASDGVVVDNREDQDFIVSQYGVPRERTYVWPSGLPHEFLDATVAPMTRDRLNRVLYVGQFAFYKGPHLLAEILNRLLIMRPHLQMTWVCQASHHAAARDLLTAEVRRRVEFRSWMPFLELRRLFDTHGLFLFPSIAEGFGRAALEAMSRGMCVVATDGSGMRDYITNGDNGCLCPIGDVTKFVDAAMSILDSPTTAEISVRASVTAQSFAWSTVTRALADWLSCLDAGASARLCRQSLVDFTC